MLQSLQIENYALIEHLEFNPERGLTVITGETGAGKSIIMGALSLILGQRADARSVRNGSTKCVIEATFDVSAYNLESFFADCDIEYDAHSTIIRREIYATGKSRAFVNDSPVQLATLKALGDKLIDIHSQHQNLLLGQDSFQQEVLDTLAANHKLLADYKSSYKELTALHKLIETRKAEAAQDAKDADYIRYQFGKLDEANLQDGEQEELEEEQDLLSHAEDIKGGLLAIAEGLNGEGESVVSILKQMSQRADNLVNVYPQLSEIADRLNTDLIDLKDIADEVSDKGERVNFDPERLAWVEERLSTIYSLEKKYDCDSVAQLIALRDSLADKMLHLDNNDDEIAELEASEKRLSAETKRLADLVTASRKKAAGSFESKLISKVAYLGMPNVRFKVEISPLKAFSPSGIDNIRFLFSANKNQPLKPAGEVASGGEISRLMLSIKALIASAKTLPTIIFDEIDTGVSGDIADRMGEVMKDMSAHLQVITITHLPQVAGKGNAHFKVYKHDNDTETTTHIVQLSDEERVNEIARMLSGSTITPEAISNAKTLLKYSTTNN